MKAQTLFRIVLVVLVLFLAVLAMRSIMRPEKFKNIYEERKNEVVSRLNTIRAVQNIYKNENKKYASDIDELVDFVENGKVKIVKNIGQIPEGMSEADAFKKGFLRKDSVFVPVKTKVLETDSTVKFKDFQYIPYTNKKKFEIETGTISSRTYEVSVYRIMVSKDDFLATMDESATPENVGFFRNAFNHLFYSNLSKETQEKNKYKDIILGSLTEASIAGNWE